MPYKDKDRDREWHRAVMKKRRLVEKLASKGRFVTPGVTPKKVELDADGNIIWEG